MTSETVSNIDDILAGGQGNSQQPATPESHDASEEIQENNTDYGLEEEPRELEEPEENYENEERSEDDSAKEIVDDYGNKTESMTEGMKKRLKKQADKYEARIQALESHISQLTPQQHQQLQQAAQSFEADKNSEEDWQRQFEKMVEQTVHNMTSKKQHEQQRAEQIRLEKEFEKKLFSGMDRFSDFRETIRDVGCEITDHMTNATRSLDDPAAFLYAASKRHPEELKRISQLRDPYAQVREMGNLEAKMRKGKVASNAPRALGKTREDANFPSGSGKKENESIEDLIAKNDAKRMAKVRGRYARG